MTGHERSSLQAIHPVPACRDATASVRFFRSLGFALLSRDMPEAPRDAAIGRDGVELHLPWADARPWAEAIDRPAYRILVDDVDGLRREFAQRHRAAMATSDGPYAVPADTPWGTREFHLHDPGGNILQFYRPR